MEFKNRSNEEVELVDGRKIWISRSPAVVGIIFAIVDKEVYILTEKRSSIMDEPNKWAVVSGYFDWDETGYDAVRREVYEETNFILDNYKDNLVFDNNKQPFYVQTDPKADVKQNVSLSYMFVYKFDKLPELDLNFKNEEISEVKWMKFDDIDKENKDWAFNHNKRIISAAFYYTQQH